MDPLSGPPQRDVLIGQTIGNYLVTQKLGEGGMGSVYLAEHPSIGKKVALKVLHPEFSSNPEVAERFFREAKAVNSIGHPNIVDVVDYGVIQSPGGRERMVYFIMEYLSGLTLGQAIAAESPMPPERALTISIQVADALAASHRAGIVHRDLKPDNIILVTRGRERDFVKLLDFGIAKLTGNDGASSHRTRVGMVMGTPAYMAPEQCEGKPNIDHRADIYALGIVLYEMLTGHVPFEGDQYSDILIKHMTQRPIEPSRYRMMSPHVEMIVLKALEKRPDMRYPTMDEFMRAMADPIGFVEAHGGLAGFLQRQLMPSSAPLPPVRMTPAPLTPMPDMRSSATAMRGGMLTPPPGTFSPVPTTMSSAAGEVSAASRTKAGFLVGGLLVVIAALGAIYFVTRDKTATGNGSGSGSEASGSGSEVASVGKTGSAEVKATGSAAVATGSGSGSAVAAAGSGSGSGSGSAKIVITPDVTVMSLAITSEPAGAEIYYNGADLKKQTPATLRLPITHDHAEFRLKLKGYDDYVFKDVPFDGDLQETATLKKTAAVVPHGHGSGSGSGSGKGSGSNRPGNDTGLMIPD